MREREKPPCSRSSTRSADTGDFRFQNAARFPEVRGVFIYREGREVSERKQAFSLSDFFSFAPFAPFAVKNSVQAGSSIWLRE